MKIIDTNSGYAYKDKRFAALGLVFGVGSAIFALASNKVDQKQTKDIRGMLPVDAEVVDEHITIHKTAEDIAGETIRTVTLRWNVGFSDYRMTLEDNGYHYEIGHPAHLLYDPKDPQRAVGYAEKERADGFEFVSILLAAAGVLSVLGGVKPTKK